MFGTIMRVYVFVTGRSTDVPCLSSSLTMHNYGTDLHSAIIHAYHYGRFNGSSENACSCKQSTCTHIASPTYTAAYHCSYWAPGCKFL